MAANIKFKRTSTTTLPTGLTFAEPAFVLGSAGTTTANQLYVGDNSGGRVWVGAKIENTVTNWTGTEANTLLATQQAIDARITSRITSSGGFTFQGSAGTAQTITPGDTVTFAAGSGISTTGSATDTITIANTGVTGVQGGTAISVSSTTGFPIITNTGVQSLTINGGDGIQAQSLALGTTGSMTFNLANTGVTGITAGSGISLNGSTGFVTITNNGVTNLNSVNGNVTLAGGTAISVTTASKTITVTNNGVQSLTLTQGSGISLTGSGTTGALSYTIANAGVTGIQAGTGISVSSATGFPTITNTGVIAFNGSTGSVTGVGSAVAGTGISVSGATGTVTFTNTGVQSAAAGSGISVSGATGAVTFTNTGVTGIQAGTAISVSSSTGNVTVTNTGVQSIAGTANQITASGSTGAVTLSLPSAVTMPGSLTVTGNLTVNGTTTTVNSTTITVQDPIISIGGLTGGAAPAAGDTKDRGIVALYRNTSDTAGLTGFFGIDQSTGYFTYVPSATVTSEVISGTVGTAQFNAIYSASNSALTLMGGTGTVNIGDASTTGIVRFYDSANSYYGEMKTGGLATANRTYTLPDASGTVVVYGLGGNTNQISSVGTLTSGTWNASLIPLAYGGTNKNLTASSGAVVYSDADSMELTAVGTSGNILKSNGTGAPTWIDPASSGFTAYAATNVTTTEQSTGTFYLTFTTGAASAAALSVDATATTALSYNVATGTLTATAVDALIDGGAY